MTPIKNFSEFSNEIKELVFVDSDTYTNLKSARPHTRQFLPSDEDSFPQSFTKILKIDDEYSLMLLFTDTIARNQLSEISNKVYLNIGVMFKSNCAIPSFSTVQIDSSKSLRVDRESYRVSAIPGLKIHRLARNGIFPGVGSELIAKYLNYFITNDLSIIGIENIQLSGGKSFNIAEFKNAKSHSIYRLTADNIKRPCDIIELFTSAIGSSIESIYLFEIEELRSNYNSYYGERLFTHSGDWDVAEVKRMIENLYILKYNQLRSPRILKPLMEQDFQELFIKSDMMLEWAYSEGIITNYVNDLTY